MTKTFALTFFSPLIIFGSILACGVKGVPLAPLTPPVLGRGEPNYSKATENLKLKKKSAGAKSNDWGEPADFVEDKEK